MAKVIGMVEWDLLGYQAEQKRTAAKKRSEKKWARETALGSRISETKKNAGHGQQEKRAEKREKLEAAQKRASKIFGLN